MANLVSGEIGGLPAEYYPQQIELQRRQKMADLLRQQNAQAPQGQMVGNQYVAPSWTQYLASALGGYKANQMDKEVGTKMQDMYKDYNTKQDDLGQKLAAALRPQQQTQPIDYNDTGMPGAEQTITKQPNANDTLSAIQQYYAGGGRDSNMANMALKQAEFGQQDQTRQDQRDFQTQQLQAQQNYQRQQAEENRAQRMQELQLRMQDARTSAQDKADLQREMQKLQLQNSRDLAAFSVANRQPQAPVAVMGPNGQPMYVPPGQAYGMKPFSAKQEAADALKVQQNEQGRISAQQVLDQAQLLFQHPGREMGTGSSSWTGSVPLISSDAKDFHKNLDTFKAQTFVPMVSALKGMGALSDAEGRKLSESVGALDPNMSEKAFADSLKNVTRTLYEKAKANGLNVSLPEFANTNPAQAKGWGIQKVQ